MRIKAVRGTRDILPAEGRIWRFIEEKARTLAERYGYRPIQTPLLEQAQLFTRSIGAGSDIVRKEMYIFSDRKERRLCLRPEATASVVRAYLEHGLDKDLSLSKFYYFGPMFRAERPQAGRLRQFHHFGIEAIGSASPYLDAEVISLAVNILKEIGINNFTLQLNSLGCAQDRQKYQTILKQALKGKLRLLCADCRRRYKINILRIFDCKNEGCQKVTAPLPSIINCLCLECRQHFQLVQKNLSSLNVAYLLNPHLVRGLDYYTKSCFEIVHTQLGAQNALGAGGRYDNLVSQLGGPERAAVGFALGLERLISVLGPLNLELFPEVTPYIFIAVVGEKAKHLAFQMVASLRNQGIAAEMDYLDKSLKGQMRLADKLKAKFVAILGEEELNKQTVILRDMQRKSQKEVALAKLIEELSSSESKD